MWHHRSRSCESFGEGFAGSTVLTWQFLTPARKMTYHWWCHAKYTGTKAEVPGALLLASFLVLLLLLLCFFQSVVWLHLCFHLR